jgi:hypothetical protein
MYPHIQISAVCWLECSAPHHTFQSSNHAHQQCKHWRFLDMILRNKYWFLGGAQWLFIARNALPLLYLYECDYPGM